VPQSTPLRSKKSTVSQNNKLDRSTGGGVGIPGLGFSNVSLVLFQGATIATPTPKNSTAFLGLKNLDKTPLADILGLGLSKFPRFFSGSHPSSTASQWT